MNEEKTPQPATIDTFVIGGSAGGITAMRSLVRGLSRDFPAAIVFCLHQSSGVMGRTVEVLQKNTQMRVRMVEDGMPLERGTIYVAIPDSHTLIGSDHLHLRRGAHENNFRPAIDPLFRSAAIYRGPRAVAVILSGVLDDGAAGARAMFRTGGKVLVLDPDDADFPGMAEATLEAGAEAEIVPADRMAARMTELAGQPCDPPGAVPWDIGLELKITAMEAASVENEYKLGTLTPFNCPHRNGVLWEIEDGPMKRYRCHTGHAYSSESLSAAQEEALDFGLFNALRSLRGRAELIRRMAEDARTDTRRDELLDRALKFEADATDLEAIIQRRSNSSAGAIGEV